MADSGTVTISRNGNPDGVQCLTFAWTTNASGDATKTTTKLEGMIQRCVSKPSAVSGLVPTADYDVTLKDRDEVDVLTGKGANRSATATESVLLTGGDAAVLPFPTTGPLDFVVDAAGDVTSGTYRVYFTRR